MAKPLELSQKQLLDGYKEGWKGFNNVDLRKYLGMFTMSTFWMPYDNFDSTTIKGLVDRFGALYIGASYDKIQYWWHSVVLYKVDEPKLGSTDKAPKYWVMDPATGRSDHPWLVQDFFKAGQGTEVLIGFKNPHGGGRALGELLDFAPK
jgi:hypothetical protein